MRYFYVYIDMLKIVTAHRCRTYISIEIRIAEIGVYIYLPHT